MPKAQHHTMQRLLLNGLSEKGLIRLCFSFSKLELIAQGDGEDTVVRDL